MTQNQIAYYRAKEEERSHRAGEFENNRHNVETERETNRHNIVGEQNQRYATDVTRDHYERSDRETERANRQREYETNRHNIADESIRRDTNIETSTHNRNVENETNRANIAREQETERANMRSENLTALRDQRSYETNMAQANARQTAADAQVTNAETQARKLAQDWVTTVRRLENDERYTDAQIERMQSQNLRDVFQNIKDVIGSASEAKKILQQEVDKDGKTKQNWIWKIIQTGR